MSEANSILKTADQILDELFTTLKEIKAAKKKKCDKAKSSITSDSSSSSSSSDSDEEIKKRKKKKHKKEKKKKRKSEREDVENKRSSKKKNKKVLEYEQVPFANQKDTPVPESNHTVMADAGSSYVGSSGQAILNDSSSSFAHSLQKNGAFEKVPPQAPNPPTKNLESFNTGHRESVSHPARSKSPRRDECHPRAKSKSPRRHGSKDPKSPGRRSGRSRSPRQQRTRSPHKRYRSKSRSPHRRRRSKSRSPHHSNRRSKSPRRSRSPHSRYRNTRSPGRHRRAPSPKSPKFDKTQLLEIAKENLRRMQEMGTLHPSLIKHMSSAYTPVRKSVAELTDLCKQFIERPSEETTDGADEKEQGKSLTRHPYEIKSPNEPRIAASQPGCIRDERLASQSELKEQFPVSSGKQHVKPGWAPISPSTTSDNKPPTKTHTEKNKTAAVFPVPRSALPDIDTVRPDVGSALAQRISSMRRVEENHQDIQAFLAIEETESMMRTWTNYQRTNLLTSEPLPHSYNWSGPPQAWAKKDQFANAPPVAHGVGMKLMQKMGWQPGEGLGRNKGGALEPLLLDIKTDKKGLVSKEELSRTKVARLISEFHGKHPISILHELCTKNLWSPPVFKQVFDMGPDHLKSFMFKVIVNGVEYQPRFTSTTKKEAKAQAAISCLQALNPFPASFVNVS